MIVVDHEVRHALGKSCFPYLFIHHVTVYNCFQCNWEQFTRSVNVGYCTHRSNKCPYYGIIYIHYTHWTNALLCYYNCGTDIFLRWWYIFFIANVPDLSRHFTKCKINIRVAHWRLGETSSGRIIIILLILSIIIIRHSRKLAIGARNEAKSNWISAANKTANKSVIYYMWSSGKIPHSILLPFFGDP